MPVALSAVAMSADGFFHSASQGRMDISGIGLGDPGGVGGGFSFLSPWEWIISFRVGISVMFSRVG